jgi:hypothetical protein
MLRGNDLSQRVNDTESHRSNGNNIGHLSPFKNVKKCFLLMMITTLDLENSKFALQMSWPFIISYRKRFSSLK